MKIEIVTCECGLIWKFEGTKIAIPDYGNFYCHCGREIKNWNEPFIWTASTIFEGNEDSK